MLKVKSRNAVVKFVFAKPAHVALSVDVISAVAEVPANVNFQAAPLGAA